MYELPIFSCEVTAYGAAGCIDFLEKDGWTQIEAQATCDYYNEAGSAPLNIVNEAGSCKNTVDQLEYVKRCAACEYDLAEPTPRTCIGRDFYMYGPAGFPDLTCQDFLAGIMEYAPWPAY
jgi:hypothetical protein